MENYHWDKFYLHMYYHADIKEVFKAWATPNGQASFFVRECTIRRGDTTLNGDSFIKANDSYEYLWEDNGKSSGQILEVNHNEYSILFTFWQAKVLVKLSEKPLGTLLELKHYDIPEELQQIQQLDCRSGWTHFLVNLKCVLEKGVDIREENPECGGTLGWGIHQPDGIEFS